MMTLPLMSSWMFSGVRSDLIREAVPYLVGELLEMKLKEEEIKVQDEKESSVILISCKWRISNFSLAINKNLRLLPVLALLWNLCLVRRCGFCRWWCGVMS